VLSPDKLEKAFSKVEKENWMLRAFLKDQEPEELDRIVVTAQPAWRSA